MPLSAGLTRLTYLSLVGRCGWGDEPGWCPLSPAQPSAALRCVPQLRRADLRMSDDTHVPCPRPAGLDLPHMPHLTTLGIGHLGSAQHPQPVAEQVLQRTPARLPAPHHLWLGQPVPGAVEHRVRSCYPRLSYKC